MAVGSNPTRRAGEDHYEHEEQTAAGGGASAREVRRRGRQRDLGPRQQLQFDVARHQRRVRHGDDAAAFRVAQERRRQAAANASPMAKELQGPKGPEPTRYGDWENKGIASDF